MVEGDRGEVVHTYIPTRKPVEAYLKLRGRFRHLFEPIRQDEAVRHIIRAGRCVLAGSEKDGDRVLTE